MVKDKFELRYLSKEFYNEYPLVEFKEMIQKVDIDKIDKIELKIPKYTGIPGSGYSYFYTIKIFENCKNTIVLDIVLERNEEKELINFFNLNNIKFEVEYYDNRNEGSD